jgi:hypothetical protein
MKIYEEAFYHNGSVFPAKFRFGAFAAADLDDSVFLKQQTFQLTTTIFDFQQKNISKNA